MLMLVKANPDFHVVKPMVSFYVLIFLDLAAAPYTANNHPPSPALSGPPNCDLSSSVSCDHIFHWCWLQDPNPGAILLLYTMATLGFSSIPSCITYTLTHFPFIAQARCFYNNTSKGPVDNSVGVNNKQLTLLRSQLCFYPLPLPFPHSQASPPITGSPFF